MMNTVIASVNISVLTAFLEFKAGLLTSSSNFPKVCKKVGDLLRQSFKMLGERERLQHAGQLTTLVFHNNKSIRIEFFGLYYHLSANPNLSINFDETVWPRLLSVTQDLLFPLVTNAASTNHSDQDKEKPHCGWTVAKYCSFSEDKQVLIHLIRPTFTEYIEKCRCSLRDERFNELHLLKMLQHAHVVQLQAFSETCWPQFYVTEDYSTNSLQTLLANKSRHNDHFTVKELLMFLIDALEGVKYLHDNNIVHRNLTAANFFISIDRKVKLSGLMDARKLSEETIRDFDCSFIPTRWTAPESLQNCQFSKMSDMWMVGHLIYEVLTHGRLPYADASLDDIELMPMVVVGRRTLCEEACIPAPVHSAIVQLTNIQPSTRPLDVRAISEQLRFFAESITEDPMAVTFPDIREKGQAAAEHRKGPAQHFLWRSRILQHD
ncbi:megakaryocyte-associated tyrosine-protein kinase-like isoform X2 [Pomacea canaliculata]|nr:megakaryocyte-associated tyrosine-protein kinase-like isoform X2 [Pomacea canaliculata]